MGFQAAAQAAGKIRFLGGLSAGKSLCALLHRPAARRGGECYQGSTRQAGYTLPSPCFFYFPSQFYFLSPGRTVLTNVHPCCAFLPTGAISPFAKLNICMFLFVCFSESEFRRVELQVGNNCLSPELNISAGRIEERGKVRVYCGVNSSSNPI